MCRRLHFGRALGKVFLVVRSAFVFRRLVASNIGVLLPPQRGRRFCQHISSTTESIARFSRICCVAFLDVQFCRSRDSRGLQQRRRKSNSLLDISHRDALAMNQRMISQGGYRGIVS